MNIFTIITAVFVLTIVWGGLAYFIVHAVKYEKQKIKDGKEEN